MAGIANIACPHCLKPLRWESRFAGRAVTCEYCRRMFICPAADQVQNASVARSGANAAYHRMATAVDNMALAERWRQALLNDVKLFESQPLVSMFLHGRDFQMDQFGGLMVVEDSALRKGPAPPRFFDAIERAVWNKPIEGSSWRLGTSELRRGSNITNELQQKAYLKRLNLVLTRKLYEDYL